LPINNVSGRELERSLEGRRVRIALLVLTVFAVVWASAAIWLSGASHGLILLALSVSLSLLAFGWESSGRVGTRGPQVGRVVGIWSTIEGLALFITANVLGNLQRADLMLPAGAIIVGLHFFPLARGMPARVYYATGSGLVLVGTVGLLLPQGSRPMIVGLGAALILWATALTIVLRTRGPAPTSHSVSRA
jgi:hypothetical protein